MIKETINESRFADVLLSDEYAGWSYGATQALYQYLDQLSDDIGEDIELDRVALRCEWSEYPNTVEAAGEYGWIADSAEDKDTNETLAREWLEERTTVLDVENVDTSAREYRTIKSILVGQF